MDNKPEIVLHSYRRCPFAIRVRMVLEEKNLPYHLIEESLRTPSEALLRLHPEGKVPLLLHKGLALPESAIITEYLEEEFPEPPLLSKVAAVRAKMRLWTNWCNHTFKPDLDLYKYKFDILEDEPRNDLLKRLNNSLGSLENALSTNDFLLENKFGLADIHVFPFYRQITKARPDFHKHFLLPNTNLWLERIQSRPAFTRVMQKIL